MFCSIQEKENWNSWNDYIVKGLILEGLFNFFEFHSFILKIDVSVSWCGHVAALETVKYHTVQCVIIM